MCQAPHTRHINASGTQQRLGFLMFCLQFFLSSPFVFCSLAVEAMEPSARWPGRMGRGVVSGLVLPKGGLSSLGMALPETGTQSLLIICHGKAPTQGPLLERLAKTIISPNERH